MELYAGIDIGTSGVRAVCIDSNHEIHAVSSVSFDEFDGRRAEPGIWSEAVGQVLNSITNTIPDSALKAVAVDGTSGTMIAVDEKSNPLTKALMYNHVSNNKEVLASIKQHAPVESAAHGATSGLAKAIELSGTAECAVIQHEADWIASCLSGATGLSDENNALKSGYDPVSRTWPAWIDKTGMERSKLPRVLRAGEPIGVANGWLAEKAGLGNHVLIVAGTTDGCASFLATGASNAGEGVTVLGSTLTIKLLSDKPIYAPQYGIYSHRIGDVWLAGGASNTGGNVLDHFFTPAEMVALSSSMDTSVALELNYYPLLNPGERFPVNDTEFQPRLSPRPESDAHFLQGIFEGIGAIEKMSYDRLAELGGPDLVSVRTVGGGARNSAWTSIRHRLLSVPFEQSHSNQAAVGTAILAKQGFTAAEFTS